MSSSFVVRSNDRHLNSATLLVNLSWHAANARHCPPFTPINIIGAMMIVCRVRAEIASWTWWDWSLSLGLLFPSVLSDTVGWVIWPVKPVPDMTYVFSGTLYPTQSINQSSCCVRVSFFSTMPRDWLGGTSQKWPILCWVGRKTLNQSARHCPQSLQWSHWQLSCIVYCSRLVTCRQQQDKMWHIIMYLWTERPCHCRARLCS